MRERFFTYPTVTELRSPRVLVDRLMELSVELLDAHGDTVCLAGSTPGDARWTAHVAYLQDLQRVGQRMLAELDGLAA